MALPLVARLVDDSADEFSGHRFAIGPAIGWVVCAVLLAVVVTRAVQIAYSVEEGSAMALLYDALPLLLILAWVVLAASLVTAHWLLAIAAGGLCAFHLILVVPRLVAADVPHWVHHAPSLDVIVANVYVDNATPHDAAAQIVRTAGDVAIIVEATPAFMDTFDSAGGRSAYPFRVLDPDDDSDYAVAIVTRHELGPRSLMTRVGPLRVAIADIEVDGVATLVVAVNPMATLDPGGHVTWKQQIDVLKDFVPSLAGPMIIAGDLNTTRYRPEFAELLDLGLMDAIDALGKGLQPSWMIRPDGVFGAVGAVVRLDHALVNKGVHPVSLRNLDAMGSDHLPFVLRVAVRTRHLHLRARSSEVVRS
ncbi:MAG: endonuclease/exonuclease/phosphatase family protein [Ilumatobacteraceae bacterium]